MISYSAQIALKSFYFTESVLQEILHKAVHRAHTFYPFKNLALWTLVRSHFKFMHERIYLFLYLFELYFMLANIQNICSKI